MSSFDDDGLTASTRRLRDQDEAVDALSKIASGKSTATRFNAEQRTNVLKFDDVQDGARRRALAGEILNVLRDAAAAAELLRCCDSMVMRRTSQTFTRWVADAIIATARSVDRSL